MQKTKGKFITIEGCEGVGKSTQTRFLKEYCEKHNVDAIFTREPGGTPVAEKIRSLILDPECGDMNDITELLLYTASRRQHTQELILPSLKMGKTVFCDRYTDSTMAYQGYARGIEKTTITLLNRLAMGDVSIDYTIFIAVSPKDGFLRKGGADKTDRLESAGIEFHERVFEGFCEIAKKNPDRFLIVEAKGTKYETHEAIISALKGKGIF